MPVASEAVLILVVLIAGIYDIKYRRIPNWLSLTGITLGVLLNTFLFEWAGVKSSLLGIGFAFIVYFPLYLLRGMGAGDVKLMMAVGALVGPGSWFAIFVITGILGGVIAVVLLLSRGRLRKTLWNVGFLLHRLMQFRAPYADNPELDVRSSQGVRLPHGAVIALGTVLFLTVSRLMAAM